MFIDSYETHLVWGNITIFLEDYKLFYFLPKMFYALQTAITSTTFLLNEREVIFFNKKIFLNFPTMQISNYLTFYSFSSYCQPLKKSHSPMTVSQMQISDTPKAGQENL